MKILIVDDHILIRKGVRLLLEKMDQVDEVLEADSGSEAIQFTRKYEPDVVILDISMPDGLDGFTTASSIVSIHPTVKVIVLTMHSEEAYVKKALQHDVSGYLLKNSEENELQEAIQAVMNGKLYYRTKIPQGFLEQFKVDENKSVLTEREKEVLRLVALGYSNIQVAEQLLISAKTVEGHKSNMMKKLELKKPYELIQYSIKNHYTDLV